MQELHQRLMLLPFSIFLKLYVMQGSVVIGGATKHYDIQNGNNRK